MTLHWIDHVLFALIVIVSPLMDYRSIRRKRDGIEAGRTELRGAMYRTLIWQTWLMTIAVVAAWFALGRAAAGLGTVTPFVDQVWIGYAVSAALALLLFAQVWFVLNNPSQRANARQQLANLAYFLPHTLTERRLFAGVSVTAGICEEVIYRGYIIAYLTVLTAFPLWATIALSSVIFGLAHIYQGAPGAIRCGVTGLVLGGLYGLTGSLWAPMIVHTLIDLSSGHLGSRLLGDDSDEAAPSAHQVA